MFTISLRIVESIGFTQKTKKCLIKKIKKFHYKCHHDEHNYEK